MGEIGVTKGNAFLKRVGTEMLERCKSWFTRPERAAMAVQKSVPLGQKAVATMLQVNGELLLLGVTSASVTLIQRWPVTRTTLEVRGGVR